MSNAFVARGFSSCIQECSPTPQVDGYHGTLGELPYHFHPHATPVEWALLQVAIAAGEIEIAAFAPPPPPTLEFHLLAVRAERDRRLSASDFTQLPDAPRTPEQKHAWAAYRDQLRTLPDTVTDTTDIDWPTPPER